ncbi:uncharacterized protein LOC143195382 [Rhynchophorus ferrugineus]|uniref:uncharacterized protein LOC143195382 n=1 Tax=Rhynchophorus ferrugineus TaxID=354439 RepID=UPI003FCD2484
MAGPRSSVLDLHRLLCSYLESNVLVAEEILQMLANSSCFKLNVQFGKAADDLVKYVVHFVKMCEQNMTVSINAGLLAGSIFSDIKEFPIRDGINNLRCEENIRFG